MSVTSPLKENSAFYQEWRTRCPQRCRTTRSPQRLRNLLERTSVDSLAISIGTSHGAYKFKLKPGEEPPSLRFDILEEVERRIPGFPIVLHGASSVMPEYVAMINKFGGKMEEAVGIPEEQLRRAAQSAVCKINIDSDGRLAMTATIRKVFAEKPGGVRSTQVPWPGT